MNSLSELFSPDQIHDAVASFNIANLNISFDADDFPFTEIQQNSNGESTGLNQWIEALHNIPTPTLAHELSHAIETATTPGGLKDFFYFFVTEYAARATIEDALQVIPDGTLPLGVHDLLSGAGGTPPSDSYLTSLALQRDLAIRLGLRVPFDKDIADRIEALHVQPGRTLLLNEERSITVLGQRHIHEGFGAAVQMIRSALDGNPMNPGRDLPSDPYLDCIVQYLRIRPIPDGSLYEFAIMLDTALLEDQWHGLSQPGRLPAETFFHLRATLQSNPDLRLASMSLKDVTSFQNDLMRLSGFSIPDVGRICNDLHEKLPYIFEEIKSLSSLPTAVLDDYYNAVDTLQRFRIEEFGGACALEALAFAPRQMLAALISNLPSGTNGPEMPVVEGDTAHRIVFMYQKSKHAAPVFDEVVFGSRRCQAEHTCVLPRRPACSGVTDDLSPNEERCARESIIGDCMSSWNIDHFEQR